MSSDPIELTSNGNLQVPTVEQDENVGTTERVEETSDNQLNSQQLPPLRKEELVPLLQSVHVVFISISFFLFLLSVLIAFVVSTFIPHSDIASQISTWQCSCDPITYDFNETCCTGSDVLTTNNIEFQVGSFISLNREFRIDGQFTNTNQDSYVGAWMKYSVDIIGITESENEYVLIEDYPLGVTFDCDMGENNCDKFHLFTYLSLPYHKYKVNLTMTNNGFSDNQLGELTLFLTTVNSKFSQWELVWRLVLLLLSCFSTLLFMVFSRKYPNNKWPFENRCTFILLLAVVIENNPLFGYGFLFGASIFLFFDIIIAALFYCSVLLYVMIIFEGLRKSASWRTKKTFWVPRLLFFGFLFLAMLLLLLYRQSFTYTDPFYNFTEDTDAIYIYVITIAFFVGYIGWLIFSVIRSVEESRRIGNTRRVITFGILSVSSIIIFAVLMSCSFLFGSNSTATLNLSIHSFLNFFVILMAIMHLPKPQKFHDDVRKYQQLPDEISEDKLFALETPSKSQSSDIESED
ncbi:Wntless-like transmembrane domain-containing protein [Entamoeba marina]